MRVGILGYGQLGRLLAMAGLPLGFSFSFYDEASKSIYRSLVPSEPPYKVGDDAFEQFLAEVDIVTYETENTPVSLVQRVQAVRPVLPSLEVLKVTQNRVQEKTVCQSLHIPTTEFRSIHSLADCVQAAEFLNFPFVLKTVTMGYDGKGQQVVRSREEIEPAWQALCSAHLIAEAWVPFDHECSLITVCDKMGRKSFYPIIKNTHHNGILRHSIVDSNHPFAKEAQKIAETLSDHFRYVGILTIEFFVTEKGLVVNELAPRVHNSGHWSIEGAATSQFVNHIRAITGLPLGETTLRAPYVAMVNIIGALPDMGQLLQIPGATVYLYGKTPRADRKLGHVTLLATDELSFEKHLKLTRTLCGALG